VSALATCSSQARECEEPHAKRQCGASTELAALDDAQKDVGAADAQPRDETSSGGVRASSEVAQSTNLKRARNVGGCKQTKKL
jgi:hypothetical protein